MHAALAAVPFRGFDPSRLLFASLTYHDSWPDDPSDWKADLDATLKRLESVYGPFPCIWRLEPQRRGAPHYHLLIFAPDGLDADAIRDAWHERVAPGDADHYRHGVDVRRVSSWREARGYLSKYMAKTETFASGLSVGRVWGVRRRALLGTVWRRWNLSYLQYLRLRRAMRRRAGLRGRGALTGLTCFLDYDAFLRLMNEVGALNNPVPATSRPPPGLPPGSRRAAGKRVIGMLRGVALAKKYPLALGR
jgi:hypothetical protein